MMFNFKALSYQDPYDPAFIAKAERDIKGGRVLLGMGSFIAGMSLNLFSDAPIDFTELAMGLTLLFIALKMRYSSDARWYEEFDRINTFPSGLD